MTEQKVYIGSIGPFIFDDTETVNDPDGDFAGENQKGVVTNQMYLADPASNPGEVVRIDELQVDTRRYSTFASPSAGGGSSLVRDARKKFPIRYMFLLS